MKLKIIEASYHRNGVGGVGFTAVLFKDLTEKRTMIASLFDGEDEGKANGYCAVYDVKELAKGNIAFARGNSWRGDVYESALRPLLEKYQEEKGTGKMGPFSIIPPDVLEKALKE